MTVSDRSKLKSGQIASPFENTNKQQPLKEFLRPLLFRVRIFGASVAARLPLETPYKPVFVLGCGRSGTTVIGNSLGADADILYLNEPYYVWYSVSPRTDFSNLLKKGGDSWLFPSDIHAKQHARFRRIMSTFALAKHRKFIVEKTPINSLRVDWLKGLDSNAKFVVVRRDWVEIVNSIFDICTNHHYGVGKRDYHVWWGENHFKVNSLLAREPFNLASPAFRDFVRKRLIEKDWTSINLNMAVFEALSSQLAIDLALKKSLTIGEDYVEIDYDRFVEAPFDEISRILVWIKNGSAPVLPPGVFDNVKRRSKTNRLSKNDILEAIHPELRKKAEAHLA